MRELREALERLLTEDESVRLNVRALAPKIERAVDQLIDAMTAEHLCEMPQDVRDRWHGVFVAAMEEEL